METQTTRVVHPLRQPAAATSPVHGGGRVGVRPTLE